MSHVMAQPVVYLGLSDSVASRPSKEEPVIVITIRPDEDSFRPHNLAIAKAQAQRLWEDLGSVLNRSAVLLAGIALASAIGCSAKVEVESASRGSRLPVPEGTQAVTGERARTAVEVRLLQDRSPEPAAALKPSQPPPPESGASEAKPVTISGNTFIVNYRAGDVTNHVETHIHVHQPPVPKVEERVVVHRDVEAEPPRRVDERCEQMARQHEQRVEMWKKYPFGR